MSTLHKQSITLAHQQREQEEKVRPLEMRLIKRLFTYTRPHARKRNLLMTVVVIRSIQLPLLALLIGRIISGPITSGDFRDVLWASLGYLALAIITQYTMYFRVKLSMELGEEVVHDLRRDIFSHLQRMPMSFFNKMKLGRILSRAISDVEAIRMGVQQVLFVSLVQLGGMIVAAGVMIYFDWMLFMVILLMAPVIWGINRHFRGILSQAYRDVQESFSRVTSTLAESVNGIRVTQGFVRQDLNSGLFHNLVMDHSRFNIYVTRVAGIFLPLLEFNNQFFLALLLLIGGWQVSHGYAEVTDLVYFFFMAHLFFSPIQVIGQQFNQALTAMAGAERIFRLLDAKPEWEDSPDAVDAPTIRGHTEFQHVDFAYEPGKPVLRDINFVAEPGQTIALVGETGSGKTTVINLIAKFYLPGKGRILIDGRDITTLRGESLHRQMGIVLQQNFLFTGSVMDNIRFGRPEANDEDIREAARKLDCLDLLEALPQGLQTLVGEKGSGISLGQRQLICFTRAMLANPRILILDEATSAVDTMTEARIQQALNRLLANRTNFVVAHRLSTIRHADQVLVLDQGRIIERGTHMELLQAKGQYSKLYREFIRAGEAK